MAAAIDKVLVIDPSGELRDFLRFCAGRFWPKLTIVSHTWARGCPDASFDWTEFDLVVMEQRLHNPAERGIDWLRQLKSNPSVPPVVMITGEITQALRNEAEEAGAAAVLSKDELSPRRFLQCVDMLLGGPGTPDPLEATLPRLARDENAPAAQVPGYRVIRTIATSARGSVCLATRLSDRQPLALKVVRLADEADAGMCKRFMKEYTTLSLLDHEHIIRVHDRGLQDGFAFIAMEPCPCGDLQQRIDEGITVPDALEFLSQILRGLEVVHERGVLHRDIKPTNLLLKRNGALVLTDFGIIRDLSDNPRLTATRSIVGDLSYVSPESIRSGSVDLRSDLYSAGVVLYQMLTGTTPFKATAVTAMLEAHLNAPIPRLPPQSAALQPIVDGLLAKDPDERFQTAAEVLEGIEWLGTERAWSDVGRRSQPPQQTRPMLHAFFGA